MTDATVSTETSTAPVAAPTTDSTEATTAAVNDSSPGTDIPVVEEVAVEEATLDELLEFQKTHRASRATPSDKPATPVATNADAGDKGTAPVKEPSSDKPTPGKTEEYVTRAELEAQLEKTKPAREPNAPEKPVDFVAIKGVLENRKTELKKEIAEKLADPETAPEAVELLDQYAKIQKDIGEVDAVAQTHANAVRAQQIVTKNIDVNSVNFDVMVDLLKEDGVDEAYINAFASNPYLVASGTELVHLARRAADRDVLNKASNLLEKIIPKYKELQEENKRLKSGSTNFLKEVSKELNSGPPLTTRTGGTSQTDTPLNVNPTEMSLEQLYQVRDKLKGKRR